MIEHISIYGVYNSVSGRKWNDMVIYHYHPNPLAEHPLDLKIQIWLRDIGYDWPMTEEQEVEFKLRFM